MQRRDAPSSLVEGIFRREVLPWALLGFTLGLVEGATVAVLVKKGYSGAAPRSAVNFAVAAVSGAPALANIVSFAWANLAHGRARVGVLATIQAAFAVAVGLIALAPQGSGGLLLTILAVIVARLLWTGVLTVRASVWTANYPRHVMARVTGRMVMVGAFGVAWVALLAGWALDRGTAYARWLYVLAGLLGLLAAARYRAVRVRREFRLLAAEAGEGASGGAFSLGMLREILHADPGFRRYMFWMGMYGSGNLMISGLLVVLFTDRLGMSGMQQIMVLTVVPLALMPLFLPWWARLFDRGHIIEYRARQCWILVAGTAVMTIALITRTAALVWVGAALIGSAMAGANLGWNLGHNDFAPLGRVQHYMGVHVTLTGVRGLIAPPAGMLCHELLERWRPGAGVYALLIPLGMVTSGAFGFAAMREARRSAIAAGKSIQESHDKT
ncbi:MAG: MFS transporter [Gammaproteobacteria bacterium]|nr:MFS transporter [Gammaproteobacteria bacterium]